MLDGDSAQAEELRRVPLSGSEFGRNEGAAMREPPMTEAREGARTRASRIIKAAPEEVYAAFMDPDVLVAWLPPARMTGRIHAFDARVGGGYRMSTL